MSLLALDRNGNPIQAGRPGASQRVSIGAASVVLGQALGDRTTLIRVAATVDCHLALGAAPMATTDDLLLPAGVVEYIAVRPGIDTLAVIRSVQDGDLFVTEIA